MKYTEARKKEIIEQVLKEIGVNAKSLRDACKVVDVPLTTVNDWLNKSDHAEQYARMRESRSDIIFEDILNIADDNGKDIRVTKDGEELTNNDVIQRSRVRIDARKWMLSKMQPKKYGDKIDVTTDGEKIPVVDMNLWK